MSSSTQNESWPMNFSINAYICFLCHKTIFDPYQSDCDSGCQFCGPCLEKFYNEKTKTTCPKCNLQLEKQVMYPDQNLEKQISNLMIDCIMDCCKWHGKLIDLSKHNKEKHPILSSPSKICDQCKMVLNCEDDLQEHKDKHCINGNKVPKRRASNPEDKDKVLKKLKNNLETEQNHLDIVQIAVSAERFSKLEEMATTFKEMISTANKNLEDECRKLKVQLENSGKENAELLRKNAYLEVSLKNRERKIKDLESFIDIIIPIPDSSLLQITTD